MCTCSCHLFKCILRTEPQPLHLLTNGAFQVRCRAPVDVLLGCRALAAAMADANEKSKPILKQWIGMSLFMTGPRQILDLFFVCVCFACLCVCVLVRGQKERHDSDEWMPKWQRYTFALNDAEQAMIVTVIVTVSKENTYPEDDRGCT